MLILLSNCISETQRYYTSFFDGVQEKFFPPKFMCLNDDFLIELNVIIGIKLLEQLNFVKSIEKQSYIIKQRYRGKTQFMCVLMIFFMNWMVIIFQFQNCKIIGTFSKSNEKQGYIIKRAL